MQFCTPDASAHPNGPTLTRSFSVSAPKGVAFSPQVEIPRQASEGMAYTPAKKGPPPPRPQGGLGGRERRPSRGRNPVDSGEPARRNAARPDLPKFVRLSQLTAGLGVAALVVSLIGAFRQRSRGEIRADHQWNDGDVVSESSRCDALKVRELRQIRDEIASPSCLKDPNPLPGS